ncbi:N-6 DNA methylase [Ralstonia wenshanensis]|uniref:N-6 DNA methylase n=1 Tax=Ralstonia wenshanensis TaxID=2842456 RepID=UPI002AAEA55C|nr:N-6 DNA methylase [Ralstonia wenshanensis]MDY7509761.1 N-6 DNA methylase [Ralstonia wenshanensis]
MLDADTKRRIDTCRDILVGKVPDPKSQVEQITIALIYKFMDDMDTQAEVLGGKRSFFINGFAQYSWPKLLSPALEGHETLSLYSQAIGDMRKNTHLPALFRDIFKNAYLPYRDPETLRSFLREIDGFTYDHSERLGDAFEYLLSVLGSQGDAGQFRTPRHIIDFMVEVVDPQKNERILDPACGTAGFLISAWKHILANNTDTNRSPVLGNLLNTKERKQLAANIHGYDISPDMVRLSLVNLYLHGFTDPHIDEYDTLTNTERWGEHADVILANPPFMSPKGGIKPHKKFSIQATRSEVLFVDYMAEHLTPEGRAAIIVPEGIIFQSGTAYKTLRAMLVKQSLIGVVSLPAGVFNPYSGVKTSILLLDKQRAKRQDKVLFVKIENDGFNLGAQRRPISQNDLPEAKRLIQAFLHSPETFEGGPLAHAVARERIAASGDWNLSGERYVQASATHSDYDLARLADLCEVNPKKAELAGLPAETEVSFVPMQDLRESAMEFAPQQNRTLGDVLRGAYTYFRDGDVLLAKVTPCFENGKAGLARNLKNGIGFGSSEYFVLRPSSRIRPELLYHLVTSPRFKAIAEPAMTGTGGLQRVPKTVLENFQVPLPPLDIQREIVVEIEGYQKIIDGARQVVENYHPVLPTSADWPRVALSELIQLSSGEFLPSSKQNPGPYPIYGGNGVSGHHDQYLLEEQTIVIGRVGAYCGSVHVTQPKSWVTDNGLLIKKLLRPIELRFLALALESLNLNRYAKIGGQPSISQGIVLEREIALPDVKTQQAIVAEIEAEQALINANKTLITRFEAKIQSVLDRIWTAA